MFEALNAKRIEKRLLGWLKVTANQNANVKAISGFNDQIIN